MFRRRFATTAVVLLLAALLGWWRYYEWRDHRFDAIIVAAAQRYSVEPALIKAVVWRESRFNLGAHGTKQEFGLMQIRAAAAQEWAQAEKLKPFPPEQLLDPATNTLAGAWYLRKLLKRYQQTDDPLPYALADYNAGRGNVLRWNKGAAMTNSTAFMGQINFPGTRQYVRTVAERYEYYRPAFQKEHDEPAR